MALGVGVIGCGNISGIYFQNCARFKNLRLVACADQVPERAETASEQYGVPACSPAHLIANHEVELILNLTIPLAHDDVNQAALAAGKHVYVEKPLAVTRDEAKCTLALALEKGLTIGCAPDTFLGAGLQTCRQLIDEGAIGRPVSATAFMTCHGHEGWHPDPEFYYKPGGGPMLDMGPYYLTALVSLIGPMKRVAAMTSLGFGERMVGSGPKNGTKFPVQVPTHVAGLIEFAQGAVGTIVTSFDIWSANLPFIEVHGTEGSLSVPDPNTFGGPIRLFRPGTGWEDVPLAHPFSENSRGLGLADLADSIEHSRPARASGELAFHVLDAMQAFGESGAAGRFVELAADVVRPAALGKGEADVWLV
jgi:predicted dehydrogenase